MNTLNLSQHFVVCVLIMLINNNCIKGLHPNVGLDEYQIMTKYGFPYEKHFVTTEDGYILEVSRVLPQLRDVTSNFSYRNQSIPFKVYPELMSVTRGEPILLMHGLTSSGRAFVSHDADKALAFILVNHGYDVYLGNARGTTRSRRHVVLDPDLNPQVFWDFSWHEIGVYDQTAMINYILTLTGFSQLSYVGHSQGGTSFLTMAATRPEINDKIKIAFSFGGPGIMRYTPSVFMRRVARFVKDFQIMMNRLKIYEFFQYGPVYLDLMKILTDEEFGLRKLSMQVMNAIDIITTHNMDIEIMPVLFSSTPAGVSVNSMFHYMQSVEQGDFRLYDYHDEVKNFQKYGSVIPPQYNLSQITCKTVLYYSKSDIMIQAKDTLLMSNQMPNAIPVEIKVKKFSHTDYMWSRDVNNYVFKDLLWRLKNA